MNKTISTTLIAAALSLSACNSTQKATDEYVDFLYSTMLTADSLDYPRDFYVRNTELALETRNVMPWGAKIPEREFKNFVLPVRVNNEHLDDARSVFYAELAPRVKNLTMAEAVLEVNHWLHEKATYRPSDSRTSPPLATIKTSFGRCGEESTLGVAAMRAVGIPARQVYTPRWAHTDDNHAWVEVWVDGNWHFLGACEPEPILDLAWFNAPAARGMLMTTNALAGYDGPEEVLSTTPVSTQINITSNYAPVDIAKVRVIDSNGAAVSNAEVRFMLYNYAEFYPIATKKTDTDGRASLTAGLGDLVVWCTAPDKRRFGFAKYSVGKMKNLDIVLDKDASFAGTVNLDIVPPRPSGRLPKPTKKQREENDRRFAYEDSVRNAYMATFFSPESALRYTTEKGWDKSAAELLHLAYGNHSTITAFLDAAKNKKLAIAFLNSLSAKDIRDITPEVLGDFYSEVIPAVCDTTTYINRVMCPRVSNETLTTYRSFFNKAISGEQRKIYYEHPDRWIKWIKENISVEPQPYARNIHTSPEKVYEHRRNISPRSRDIFVVASLRSFGVPAYLDPVNARLHYVDTASGKDTEVIFADNVVAESDNAIAQGTLKLDYKVAGRVENPGYYTHFSLASLANGAPSQLNFDDDANLENTFANGIKVDAGQMLLVSGQRLADGTVMAQANIFNVKPATMNHEALVIRQSDTEVQVLGNFNSENIYHDIALNADKSLLSTTGRGYYVIALISPNHEPSSHILNDISACAADFEKWGGKLMLLFRNEGDAARFKAVDFPKLPKNVVFGIDVDGKISSETAQFGSSLPLVLIADTFNRVVFISEGYTINIGKRLIETLSKIETR